jgi:hypothetical protein
MLVLLVAASLMLGGCGDDEECLEEYDCAYPTEAWCSKFPGCSWTPGCEYFPCNEYATAADCAASAVCVWHAPNCQWPPIPEACTVFSDTATCSTRNYCVWSGRCSNNEAVQCSDAKSEAACAAVGRCRWHVSSRFQLG